MLIGTYAIILILLFFIGSPTYTEVIFKKNREQ